MFIDEVTIEVIAGRGGDGCMAFRREKYVSMGGPFGGTGGDGGNIIFKAEEGLKTGCFCNLRAHIYRNPDG